MNADQKKWKATRGDCPKLWRLIRNWAHQSYFYLDRTERLARAFLEVVLIMVMVLGVAVIANISLLSIWLWLVSFLLVHTLNWVFNSNWRACILFALPWLRNPGTEVTCRYLNALSRRLHRDGTIAGVMIFGSICRGEWHNRSDLDVRILRRPGFCNGVRAVLTTMRERLIAVFAHQPLDVYLADDVAFLEKMRKDEIPVFLVKRSGELERRYPQMQVHELQVSDLTGGGKTHASS